MNQQIKSHWKLALKSFVKALQVTFSVPVRNYKARRHMLRIDQDIRDQRKLFATIEKANSGRLTGEQFDIWKDRIEGQYL